MNRAKKTEMAYSSRFVPVIGTEKTESPYRTRSSFLTSVPQYQAPTPPQAESDPRRARPAKGGVSFSCFLAPFIRPPVACGSRCDKSQLFDRLSPDTVLRRHVATVNESRRTSRGIYNLCH